MRYFVHCTLYSVPCTCHNFSKITKQFAYNGCMHLKDFDVKFTTKSICLNESRLVFIFNICSYWFNPEWNRQVHWYLFDRLDQTSSILMSKELYVYHYWILCHEKLYCFNQCILHIVWCSSIRVSSLGSLVSFLKICEWWWLSCDQIYTTMISTSDENQFRFSHPSILVMTVFLLIISNNVFSVAIHWIYFSDPHGGFVSIYFIGTIYNLQFTVDDLSLSTLKCCLCN